MTDDHVTLVVEFHAVPGRGSELRRLLLGLVTPTRAEEGCLLYDLHEDPADPDALWFYEQWASAAHHAAHDLTSHVAAAVGVLPQLTASAPRMTRLRRIEPTPSAADEQPALGRS
jgi:quinol monooxygenase YgiN